MAAKVDSEKGTGCEKCVEMCSMEAIEIHEGKAIIGEGCGECGARLLSCPKNVILL